MIFIYISKKKSLKILRYRKDLLVNIQFHVPHPPKRIAFRIFV